MQTFHGSHCANIGLCYITSNIFVTFIVFQMSQLPKKVNRMRIIISNLWMRETDDKVPEKGFHPCVTLSREPSWVPPGLLTPITVQNKLMSF